MSASPTTTAPDLRMDAYHYSFEPTGVREIDLILSAVACAGKAFHETADWHEDARAYDGHTGNTPIEWIQNAANAAAAEFRAQAPAAASGEAPQLQADTLALMRKFIENIATPKSEPLNTIVVLSLRIERQRAMGKLREQARVLLEAVDAAAAAQAAPAAQPQQDARDEQIASLRWQRDRLLALIESAGGAVKIAHFGVELGATSWARKVTDVVEAVQAERGGATGETA